MFTCPPSISVFLVYFLADMYQQVCGEKMDTSRPFSMEKWVESTLHSHVENATVPRCWMEPPWHLISSSPICHIKVMVKYWYSRLELYYWQLFNKLSVSCHSCCLLVNMTKARHCACLHTYCNILIIGSNCRIIVVSSLLSTRKYLYENTLHAAITVISIVLFVFPGDYTLCVCPGIANSSESLYIRTFVHHAQTEGFRVAVLNHLGALKDVRLTSSRIFTYGGYHILIYSAAPIAWIVLAWVWIQQGGACLQILCNNIYQQKLSVITNYLVEETDAFNSAELHFGNENHTPS